MIGYADLKTHTLTCRWVGAYWSLEGDHCLDARDPSRSWRAFTPRCSSTLVCTATSRTHCLACSKHVITRYAGFRRSTTCLRPASRHITCLRSRPQHGIDSLDLRHWISDRNELSADGTACSSIYLYRRFARRSIRHAGRCVVKSLRVYEYR